MARKAKHDQRELGTTFRCEMCQIGVCSRCIDVARMSFGISIDTLCHCGRENHKQEVDMTIEATVTEFMRDNSSESALPTYRYRRRDLEIVWQTSVPRDDEAAIAYFHVVVRFGPEFRPVYCEAITRDESGEHCRTLKQMFDPERMETKPFKVEF